MSNGAGKLYVVATPIGNLEDISLRALRVLGEVDLIAAEDTRHSRRLMQHYGIRTPLRSYHDFNEEASAGAILERLQAGDTVALISDAGTPLISDPGYRLVRQARELGVRVIPVPGPSALTAALSAAGLPTDRFAFEGFAPARPAQRRAWLEGLRQESRTVVFYETPHRIQATLAEAAEVFGPQREAVVARELTKQHESLQGGSLGQLRERLATGAEPSRGEFVVLIHGEAAATGEVGEGERLLRVLLRELPLKQAVSLASRITGAKRNDLYKLALTISGG